MSFNNSFKSILIKSGFAASVLLLSAGAATAQVALTAKATSTTLPDGQTVPMWGLFCTPSTTATVSGGGTCASVNPAAGAGTTSWAPPLITVQAGGTLTVTLTNSLKVPTSLVIVGQLGAGLGASPTRAPSPVHTTQDTTWPIAAAGPTYTPPTQSDRVQSFATEVAAGATTTAGALTWTGLKAGTYLLESGTHPSIQGPMGLYGIVVVTDTTASPATAYPAAGTLAAVKYDSDVPLLLSEIDPVQNSAVATAVGKPGFSETTVWSGQPGGCADPASATYLACYPPAVNYDPRYYLINGVSFDRTQPATSNFGTNIKTDSAGNVLLRFVNAGLRMHVPSVVGANMTLIAEDGNVLPGVPKVQSEVFLAAGKTYDVLINPVSTKVTGAYDPATYPVYDRQLSLSTNNQRDGGMQAYVQINGGAAAGTAGSLANTALTAKANPDNYSLVKGNSIVVNDPSKGLIANDVGVSGVTLLAAPSGGTVTLNANGTFTYVPTGTTTTDSFSYCANGTVTGTNCSSGLVATVTLAACSSTASGPTPACLGGAPTANADSYASNVASFIQVGAPGVLLNDTDPAGHPLTVSGATSTVSGAANVTGGSVTLNPDGSFTAAPSCAPTCTAGSTVTFKYAALNSQNTASTATTVTVTFNAGSGLTVNVTDGPSGVPIKDYRWIIEEDRTFHVDPSQVNTGGPTPSLGTNFHTSYMPVVAAGCVGTIACEGGQTLLGSPAVCDVGNGVCRTSAAQQTPVDPSQVHLDPSKYYYISILPGDAGNSYSSGAGAPQPINPNNPNAGNRQFSIATDCGLPYPGNSGKWVAGPGGICGHGMGGAPISAGKLAVNVPLQETPFQPAKISVFVFEDDSPLNGENDAGGGVDVLAPTEPGLGGFEIRLWDDAGGTGDATGQMTYDMFNMPLSNSLAGTIDPATGNDACPISPKSKDGIVGMIVTCPKYEARNGKPTTVLSPLAGQAVIANMMPGRYAVQADPGADRIAKGEEWLQTNTLDGQKAHDSFIKVGGPAYFQEFGPAGFHTVIGFANPAIINARLGKPGDGKGLECSDLPSTDCKNVVKGTVTMIRQSRGPDQRLYSSGDNTGLAFTQCYVSLGDPDGADIAFVKCDSNGYFELHGIPNGNWRVTVFDQWNDEIVDGLSTPVALTGSGYDFGGGISKAGSGLGKQQWHTDIATTTFLDLDKNGVRDATDPGLPLVATNIRFRDGSYSNFNNTDLNGYASFNEVFPLFNWYVIETDTTRFKQTGVHVVYDAGGPADCAPGNPSDCVPGGGTSVIADHLANTIETTPLPNALRVPGSVYCDNADCTNQNRVSFPNGGGPGGSTGRIDPPWATTEAWQGFIGSYEFLEFGKTPYAPGENGGIHGEVTYASTRPFDDPALLIHTSWTPNVPNVTINLYQETTAADGTQTLKLVDTTKTTSWDDWAQGFRSDGNPNMNCPGQKDASADLFFFTLKDTPNGLNPSKALPNDSQFKCYDGLHNFNQVQPAPYDGMYSFPSVTSINPTNGKPAGTNCSICTANPTGDGTQMLPAGKYVVEMVLPPGYELVKEEDKNILIGDNYIAPVTQQFGGLGNVFIMPDQAQVNAYNANNAQNPTSNLGTVTLPTSEGDTGSVETKWPCVGAARIVPDFISLFPNSHEVAPFAGATRNLCDRKEVLVQDQASVLAKFWVFSSTHVAAHFTGFILDDLSSEFDPFSPQFGEKFAVPNLPISIKDFTGTEVLRTYADQWGTYNGLNYSTWEVNPPNPTGYAPTMMVACMNDPGTGTTPDPYYNPAYSQFCYEIPYMPGQTQYMDTPVVPTASFAEGYNPPDCAYPDTTPAIASVLGDTSNGGQGPWVSAAGHTLTITALGAKQVPNPAYTGPQATTDPYNKKFITRTYSFGTTPGTVTIGGVNAKVDSWSDTAITVEAPSTVPSCSANGPLQRNGTGSNKYAANCGQLVITAANGKQSIDTVMVTVGGKAPSYVAGENGTYNAIQTAIDKATPGDLIIVGPGVYNEMVLMWKPVRLQGVGAASSIINANTHPSGKLDPWRAQVSCLFGLRRNGSLLNDGTNAPFDATGQYSCPTGSASNPLVQRGKVDPLPLEGIVGWDTTLNGNLAELLQEPSLMGAYEGAAITVLGKGENLSIGPGSTGAAGTEGDFPTGSRVLTASNSDCNNFPSNFLCNPSRIDGLTLTDSSQGGGAIYVHAWNHYLEISNDRISGNAGTLSGGITIGQADSPDAVLDARGVQQPFLYDHDVKVHNNSITSNSSYGDELFSSTPSAAGGATFCTGADYYHFNYNWVCGNLSTGDGGGLAHEGFIYNGDISHNWILFNQSNNITIPTHGGGIAVLGAGPDGALPGAANAGTECGSTTDIDCAPGLTDGIGPGLVIDSNLIMGNTAESGSGGGIRLELINGNEVVRFPTTPTQWYGVNVTNNIIANNVAGWDGGGVSLQDALAVNFINNTVVSNDTTASAGVLFNTLGAPQAGTPPPNCDPTNNPTCAGVSVVTSTPQAAGLVTMQNTSNLTSGMPATIRCPTGHGIGGTGVGGLTNASCRSYSYPVIENDLFWQNRTFNIQVGGLGSGLQSQQNLVTLVPELMQAATGQCVTTGINTTGTANVGYWDIGVRGDTGPNAHQATGHPASYYTLSPSYSILTDVTSYAGAHNTASNPNVVSLYCNGSRSPPEGGSAGYAVPPGIADATTPNPLFNLTPAATVDEGNNWINMTYGPLAVTNATMLPETSTPGAPAIGYGNGNYGLTGASTAAIGAANAAAAPSVDYFGTPRKTDGKADIGAVEYKPAAVALASVNGPLAFGNVVQGTTSAAKTLTLSNTGGAALTGITLAFSAPTYSRPAGAAGGTCGATLAATSTCTINVTFAPTALGAVNATLTITGSVAITGSPVALSGTGVAPVVSATLTPATWSPSQTRNCPGSGFLGALACAGDPYQAFTLTNTGNVTLTGIGHGTLGGTAANQANYALRPLLSSCGAAGGGQLVSNTTLAPGATCVVTLQFQPQTGQSPAGLRPATVSVTDAAGTQSSTLSGSAN